MLKNTKNISLYSSYLLVVIVLFLWVTFAYITFTSIIDSNKVYGQLINISGKQRTLSQQTSLSALKVQEHGSKHIKELKNLTAMMRSDYQFLTSNLTSEEISQYYFDENGLDSLVQHYFSELDDFIIKHSDEKAEEIFQLSEKLLPKLDRAVKLFEEENMAEVERLENLEGLIYTGIILTLILQSFFIIVPIIRKHTNMYKDLEDNLHANIHLLNEYKGAVDESSIVSKTDKKGYITYVNDKFCEITGFSREELIGKRHNLVRHPDMPKEVYYDLWKTIMNKKTWSGEIKNIKKDGSHYVVLSTVKPILDANGEIEEFISIRHDITESYDLREEIENTQKEVIFTMGAIAETRSKETGNHVKRVAEYSRVLAKGYGLEEKEVEMIAQASPMHDIGKVAIPDNILHKPGRLTTDEFIIMRKHAELGYDMLKHSTRPLMKLAATIALEHHEFWNGEGGYPQRCKGEEISIAGRITAIADVFDALGSDRVYKKAWDDEKIFELLKTERGKQFEPKLVDIFFEHLEEILEIREKFRDV